MVGRLKDTRVKLETRIVREIAGWDRRKVVGRDRGDSATADGPEIFILPRNRKKKNIEEE